MNERKKVERCTKTIDIIELLNRKRFQEVHQIFEKIALELGEQCLSMGYTNFDKNDIVFTKYETFDDSIYGGSDILASAYTDETKKEYQERLVREEKAEIKKAAQLQKIMRQEEQFKLFEEQFKLFLELEKKFKGRVHENPKEK